MNETQNLFLLAGAWTLVVAGIVFFVPRWPNRILLFTLLVGIPFWELPAGYSNFREVCRQDATLRVFESIGPQDAICVERLDARLFEGLDAAGFKRIEVLGFSDDPARDRASGKVVQAKRNALKSRVCLATATTVSLPGRISREDVLITSASDGHAIARQSSVTWSGMWWQDVGYRRLGRGGACYDDPARPLRFVRYGVT